MSKAKGSRAERELLHLFWDNGWYCIRMAGSGSMPLPCPDLLSGKKGRTLAIECKSGKGKQRRYIEKKQINELTEFARGFGAQAWVAVRFNNMGWCFLKPNHLGKSKGIGNYYFDKNLAAKKGIVFEDFLKLSK